MNITDKQAEYCEKIAVSLENKGFRVQSDLRNEKVGFKIREHTVQRVPYLLVAGDKEVAANTISVRDRTGKDLGVMELSRFETLLQEDVASYSRQAKQEKS